jgi:hypothetical protein
VSRRTNTAPETARLRSDARRCNCRDDRQWSQVARHSNVHFACRSSLEQEISRSQIAAVRGCVDQRPEFTTFLGYATVAVQQARSDAEQNSTSKPESVSLRQLPRKLLKGRKPTILEPRKLLTSNAAGNQLRGDVLEPRLGWWRSSGVEFLEPLSPPGEPDGAEARITARRNDVSEGEVKIPQCCNCVPNRLRELLERDRSIVIEPPVSDSKRPSLPRLRRPP